MRTVEADGYLVRPDEVPVWSRYTRVERVETEDGAVLECQGCGHQWRNRKPNPRTCPSSNGCGAEIAWERDQLAGENHDDRTILAQADADGSASDGLVLRMPEEQDAGGDDDDGDDDGDGESDETTDLETLLDDNN